ncbi:MotE family protein [Roseibium aggregatum]|uniref:Flagellar motility protein MotE (MotC chaperone) n=1 Tax=Roseibium aggregatum TaxID=187304 RepID=A0A939EH15_9HYPH|nr:hypothetical protein [Roseibium aggregatum]MBN9671394.1 hypothetical protein [Roseibium aggregatum]
MNLRLLPLLGLSASALLALKLLGLVLGPNSASIPINGAVAQETATENAGEAAPDMAGENTDPAAAETAGEDAEEQPVLPQSLEIGGSAAERAVLESLGKRRETLQEQEGQLDLREKLLKATEQRIQKQLDELRKLEESIGETVEQKEEQERDDIAALVTMYENMKPKDAARIFDRLSMPILLKVVRQMKARKMAAILAKMSPEAAEKLTVAIASDDPNQDEDANEAKVTQGPMQDVLPKIPSN